MKLQSFNLQIRKLKILIDKLFNQKLNLKRNQKHQIISLKLEEVSKNLLKFKYNLALKVKQKMNFWLVLYQKIKIKKYLKQ